MIDIPDTSYVAVGDADVAYQVVGDGAFDLLYFRGLWNIDAQWEYPPLAEFLGRLASFSRLILFDRRGTGVSDAVAGNAIPTWEEWTEDVRAVLDAAGSRRAAVWAEADAGPIGILFAAVHPERVQALVLGNTSCRYLVADDYPIGFNVAEVEALVESIARSGGGRTSVELFWPEMAADPEFIRFGMKFFRSAATPRTAAAQYRYMLGNLDVRGALEHVQTPTLVLHQRGENPMYPVEHARYLADHIEGAKLVELTSQFERTFPASSAAVGEVAEFVTGQRPPVEVDRVLTTVLFTDIVGSTGLVASMGDHRWRQLLDAHDRAVRQQLRRFRGREVDSTGDGFHASFDGPARAIRCARAINDATRTLGLEVRAGLHTGECEVRGHRLAGLAVHVAARVGALARAGEVLVSRTVVDLVAGSGIEFEDRGEHELKGVPGAWRLYAVSG